MSMSYLLFVVLRQVFSGFADILALSVKELLDNRSSVDTVMTRFDVVTADMLAKCPRFALGPDSSVFMPAGWLPLIVGTPRSDSDDSFTLSSVVQHFIMQKDGPSCTKPSECVELATALTKSFGVVRHKSILKSSNELKLWMADWKHKEEATYEAR